MKYAKLNNENVPNEFQGMDRYKQEKNFKAS